MARSGVTRLHLRKQGNFSIEGYDKLLDKVEKSLDRTTARALKSTFMEGAVLVRDRAKELVPVDTGLLQSAIFAAPGDPEKPDALVGVSRSQRKTGSPAAPHGVLVEFGTAKMPARPFLRPAIVQMRGAVAQKVLGGIEKAALEPFK